MELKKYQRVAGKVDLKPGERGFVQQDGTVVATDMKDPTCKADMKLRAQQRTKKRNNIIAEKANNKARDKAKKLAALEAEKAKLLSQ